MKFIIGSLFMTHTINVTRVENTIFASELKNALDRYFSCDWGDLTDYDKQLNDSAVQSGEDRILAAYNTSEGKIYIITEWDRSYTTVLFSCEY